MARRQEDPRSGQKARTRAAIVAAAQRLRQEAGATPTVAEAAEASGVSRATAYRYFPTQEALDIEIADVIPAVAAIERDLVALDTPDVEQRLLALLEAFNLLAVAEEAHFRRALWVYQDIWLRSHRVGHEPPAVREGRRMSWLEQVLEPLDLPSVELRRLQAALALTLGMDSLVVMKDVCGLGDEEAVEVLRWAATAILRAGLGERGDARGASAAVT